MAESALQWTDVRLLLVVAGRAREAHIPPLQKDSSQSKRCGIMGDRIDGLAPFYPSSRGVRFTYLFTLALLIYTHTAQLGDHMTACSRLWYITSLASDGLLERTTPTTRSRVVVLWSGPAGLAQCLAG